MENHQHQQEHQHYHISDTKEYMTDIPNYSTIYEEEQNQEPHTKNDSKKDETLDIEAMAAAITAAVQSGGRGTSSMALGNASIIPNRGRSQSESTRSTTNNTNRRSSASNRHSFFFNNNNNKIIPQDAMAARPKRSSSMSSQHSLPPLIKSSSSASTRSRSSSTSTSRHYSARFSWLVGPSGMANDNQQQQQQEKQQTQQHRVGQEPTIIEENAEPSVDDGRRELMYRGIQVKEIKTTLKTMVIPHEVENPMPKVELQRPGFARINY